mmetsp:Transcript_108935/g.308143  ORF Transcript_108935/g.308143 Transcript_108935/m.308143 type:complete len:273 (+) Transcript_108935:490-1308(+)
MCVEVVVPVCAVQPEASLRIAGRAHHKRCMQRPAEAPWHVAAISFTQSDSAARAGVRTIRAGNIFSCILSLAVRRPSGSTRAVGVRVVVVEAVRAAEPEAAPGVGGAALPEGPVRRPAEEPGDLAALPLAQGARAVGAAAGAVGPGHVLRDVRALAVGRPALAAPAAGGAGVEVVEAVGPGEAEAARGVPGRVHDEGVVQHPAEGPGHAPALRLAEAHGAPRAAAGAVGADEVQDDGLAAAARGLGRRRRGPAPAGAILPPLQGIADTQFRT